VKVNDLRCEMMQTNLAGGETAVAYVSKFREYGIRVLDGGSSFIAIDHCPWCGKVLPAKLRDAWFEEIEARGFEVDDEAIPAEFTSEALWRTRR
jgi:hypothetical protein